MDASLLKAYKEVVFSEEDELTERIYPTPKKKCDFASSTC